MPVSRLLSTFLAVFGACSSPSAARAEGSPSQGELVATVRVLVYNVYGRKEKDCAERYEALAAEVLAASPPYDIVALQEHWKVPLDPWFTCDAAVMTRALEADGRYAGKGRSIRHLPSSGGAFEVAGGNSVFTRHRIVASHEDSFDNGRRIPLSGFALARVELSAGVELDLWDVHLEAASDGCDQPCRKKQAADVAAAVERFSGSPGEERSGNPVLVVGDFNVGGPLSVSEKPPYAGNAGYDDVLVALRRPRDLWLEGGSGDGFTYDCANNPTQTCKGRERIDYMFLPEDPALLAPTAPLVLVPKTASVVRWKTPKGRDVSDHYGLDATLELRRLPSPPGPGFAQAFSAVAARLEGLSRARIFRE